MSEEEIAQSLFLLHVAVLRRERTDWYDGRDHIEMMWGESPMEPEEKQPIDPGWLIVFGVWLLVGLLLFLVTKKVVAS